MSQESLFSSNSEREEGTVNKKVVKSPKPERLTSSMQSNKLSLTKASFQNMLTLSNNKYMELLKNKQNAQEHPKGATKCGMKMPADNYKHGWKNQSPNELNVSFSPAITSTQIKDIRRKSTHDVDNVGSAKHLGTPKGAKRKRETLSSSENGSDSESSSNNKNNISHEKIEKLNWTKKPKVREQIQQDSQARDEKVKFDAVPITSGKKEIEAVSQITRKCSSDSDSSPEVSQKNIKLNSAKRESKSLCHKTASVKSVAQLKRFEDSKSLMKVNVQGSLLDISVSEEVFTVQIPKSLEPSSLVGRKISLSKETRISDKGRKYDCIPSHGTKGDFPIFNNTQTVHFARHARDIKIQRHVKLKHAPLLPRHGGGCVAFPSNLKQRHPLFGADYLKKVEVDAYVQQKLEEAVKAAVHRKKKKKSKHSSSLQKSIKLEENEEIFKFLSGTTTLKAEKESKKSSHSHLKHQMKC